MSTNTNVFSVPGGNIFPSATSGFRAMRTGTLNGANILGQQSLASAPSPLAKPKGVQNALQNTPQMHQQTPGETKMSNHSSGIPTIPVPLNHQRGNAVLLEKLASEFGPRDKTAIIGSAVSALGRGLKYVSPTAYGGVQRARNAYNQSGIGKAIGKNVSLSGAMTGLEAGMGADVATGFLSGNDDYDGYGTLGGLAAGAFSPRLRQIAKIPGLRWTGGQTAKNIWNGAPIEQAGSLPAAMGLRRGLNTAGWYGLAGDIQETATDGEFNMARPIQSMRAAADRQAQMAGFQNADEMQYVAQRVKEDPESRMQFFARLARLAA